MKNFFLTGAAAAAILAGGAALAQTAQPAQPAPQPAHTRHVNTARPVTRADIQARVAKAFAKLDSNHDGFITKQEVSAAESAREQKIEQRAERFDPSKMFDRLDLNHDGQITAAEAQAARQQHASAAPGKPAKAHAAALGGLFARADANKDNVVTRAEFDAMGQQLKARMEKAGLARGGMATRMFDMSDTNKDGKISLAEMQEAALAKFDRLDLNHDGTITPDERQQARQLSKGQHHNS